MNKPSQPDTRKGKYDRDGDRLRGAVDSAADLVSGAETSMTESRGAMTAQQFRIQEIESGGIFGPFFFLEDDASAYALADTLSARNTAQLTKELADVREVLAKGIDRAPGDESVYQLAVIATNGIYWRDQELSRLRSQGAGQFEAGRDAAAELCSNRDFLIARDIRLLQPPAGLASPPEGRQVPAEQPSDFDGWGRYWASLDKDSQERLTAAGTEAARAWFGIGAVWGKKV